VTVSAILLAAGESRRMGMSNKLEIPIAGVPLLRRSAKTLLASRLREIIVVLGHAADVSRQLLQGLPLTLVENPHYREGQMSSVFRGLDALVTATDGVMVCLADQPLLTPTDIDRLIAAFDRQRNSAILVPTWHGQRGNPLILARKQRATILQGRRNLGCKRLIERNPELVTTFAMPNDHVVFDLDTPGDYAALQERLSWTRRRAASR
jgi:molybdenum cofactor cytidylyltransferase